MFLLFIIPHMRTGGAQRLLADIIPLIAREEDMRITLLTYEDTPDSPMLPPIRRNPAIRIVNIGIPLSDKASLNPLIRRKAVSRMRPFIREADICHVHLFPALYDAALASRGLPAKLIFTDHNTRNRRRHPLFRPLEQRIYDAYDTLACVSPACARSLSDWLRLPRLTRKIEIVENGIDVGRFSFIPPSSSSAVSPAVDSAASEDSAFGAYALFDGIDAPASSEASALSSEELLTRFRAGITHEMEIRMKRAGINSIREIFGRDGLPLLMVSRFVDSKDQDDLIRALALLKSEAYRQRLKELPPLFVAFAGSGARLESCRRLSRELGVENEILFLGDRNDIPQLIATSAAGVQLSRWEGLVLTALEMLAGALPVVASDTPAISGILKGSARLVKNDPQRIADAICDIITPESPETFSETLRMQEHGRETAERHNVRNTASDYLRLYLKHTTP